MDDKRAFFVTDETDEDKKLPLLIVDKKGIIGIALAQKMQEEFLVVLVSGYALEAHQNTIHIPYRRKIPLVPDNAYSHIFIVYNGEKEVLAMLPAFVKKANEGGAKVFFITHVNHSSQKLFLFLGQHLFHNVRIVLFGETFDNNIVEANEVNFFIHQVRVYGRIAVPNTGMGKLYPIFLDDVLSAIIAIAFTERSGKTFLLFPHHPITEVSVGRMFQKIDPALKIDFKRQKIAQNDFYVPPDGVYFFENYDLEERFRRINLNRSLAPSVVSQKQITLVLPRRKKEHSVRIYFLAFLVALLLPSVFSLVLAFAGAGALSLSVKQMEKVNFSSARSYAVFARSSLSLAGAIGGSVFVPPVLGTTKKGEFLQQVGLGSAFADTEVEALNAFILLQDIYEQKSDDPKRDFYEATATLKNIFITMQKMKGEGQLPKSVLAKLTEMEPAIKLFENTADAWPVLLGFEGKKNYLVLFQNNMELRPGGGFIGSYAVLSMENGKVGKFQVHDVYDADGKLSTHVEAPYGLRRYLGASHWFLRDSNFNPDFPESAAEALRFLKLETGQTADGVIAIDTDFLKNILSVLGSVTLDDYKETVTADNFYLLTQTHAEKDFFPGSTQKKDFLRALTSSLVATLSEGKNIPYQKLLAKTAESVGEKHVLFSFSDRGIQNLFTVNNLSSSLWDGRLTEENSIHDFFGLIDANVGANKTNYYLKRSIRQDGVIDETGDYQTTATVTYENTSKKDSIFGGDYKNYVRFILPASASLQAVQIDGKELGTVPAITDPGIFTKKDFVPPSELEVEKVKIKEKEVVGFLLIVPAGSTKTVGITYAIPQSIAIEKPFFSYDLSIFKQPGTDSDPYSLFVSYPAVFALVKSDSQGRDLGGKFVYSANLSEDKNIRLEFSKK